MVNCLERPEMAMWKIISLASHHTEEEEEEELPFLLHDGDNCKPRIRAVVRPPGDFPD